MALLRDVVESDLDAFFEYQCEPEANEMAIFPARDRESFDAHWRRILADPSVTVRTIDYDGAVAGNVGSWEQEGRQLVGYWIGREFWGRGIATSALSQLVAELGRPLYAWAARSNLGSIRVLIGRSKNLALLEQLLDRGDIVVAHYQNLAGFVRTAQRAG